jgi:hypothetical protein
MEQTGHGLSTHCYRRKPGQTIYTSAQSPSGQYDVSTAASQGWPKGG